ncbi:hypothetical protein A2U01_0093514, partial [Trifolium medium]|nr:hypothetical protein [Trifolium medium]
QQDDPIAEDAPPVHGDRRLGVVSSVLERFIARIDADRDDDPLKIFFWH